MEVLWEFNVCTDVPSGGGESVRESVREPVG